MRTLFPSTRSSSLSRNARLSRHLTLTLTLILTLNLTLTSAMEALPGMSAAARARLVPVSTIGQGDIIDGCQLTSEGLHHKASLVAATQCCIFVCQRADFEACLNDHWDGFRAVRDKRRKEQIEATATGKAYDPIKPQPSMLSAAASQSSSRKGGASKQSPSKGGGSRSSRSPMGGEDSREVSFWVPYLSVA